MTGEILYENSLSDTACLRGWRAEGDPVVTFPGPRMRLESARPASEGQAANFVFWCPEIFPADVRIEWSFTPVREPGLAMFWFAAAGTSGRDLFDPTLAPRSGEYQQYHSGDINAYHLAYFRRRYERERSFHVCNLRRSHGFHLVAQGADPIPGVADVVEPYRIALTKTAGRITFAVNELVVLDWKDDGSLGPVLSDGRIGFRQMAPLVADYADLVVRRA